MSEQHGGNLLGGGVGETTQTAAQLATIAATAAQTVARMRSASSRPPGPATRRPPMRSGRSSAVKTPLDQIRQVADGELSCDTLGRAFIREQLSYRFVVLTDAAEARALETRLRMDGLSGLRPLLNPGRTLG